ncbi:MAG: amidohydrolase family protein, partial [Spirochaetia bacterium]|nr:amidohydrolase family protein [Spirochaetia bacterium]
MKADSIFSQARIFNPFLKTWETADIAVLNGRILYVGDAEHAGISSKIFIDCGNTIVMPGMIDIHLHIESSLCTPIEFAKAVLNRGVTTVVAEPHEIANVFGVSGISAMVEASKDAPIDIFYGIPSSVPSTNSSLETTGGKIGPKELKTLIADYPDMICLGEVMNYRHLITHFDALAKGESSDRTIELIRHMKKQHPLAAIEGHCPSVRDLDLAELLYFGIDSDHCLQDTEGMRQRFERGMFVEIQEKSVTESVIHFLESHDVDGLYSFVTDDVPPDILTTQGHLDHVVRKALSQGLSLEKAITASTRSPAERIGFRDRGVIAPGKTADFIMLSGDGSDFTIKQVFRRGIPAEESIHASKSYSFPESFAKSVTIDASFSLEESFDIPCSASNYAVCRVMKKNRENTYTAEAHRKLPVRDGRICWEEEEDLNLVLVVSRYGKETHAAHGFISGDILHDGAMCSTYAHDHHNILIVGSSKEDMTTAYNRILSLQGGICTVSDGSISAELPLSVGGILSEEPLDKLSSQVVCLQKSLRDLGIEHANPIMTMCTLTLPVSPELKITDRGLISTKTA